MTLFATIAGPRSVAIGSAEAPAAQLQGVTPLYRCKGWELCALKRGRGEMLSNANRIWGREMDFKSSKKVVLCTHFRNP
jgi:hypothetical protein